MFLFSLSSSYLTCMSPDMKSRPWPIQLVCTVWGMDWSPTNHQASLKILPILANLNTGMMLFSTALNCTVLYCTCMILQTFPKPDSPLSSSMTPGRRRA